MAKKTKNSNLSLEERLEQALIPNWDEPYKLPKNWCWVKLSTVCSLENGEKSTEKDLVYLDAKTLRGIAEPQTRDSGIIVNKDRKVILVDGENSGEVFVVPYRGYMGSTFKIINISANADEMYIRYFIDQNREKLRNSKVGSAIPHLNKDLFFDLKLPFPPLSEQKRIVAHIETLFAKLDEAKEKAQEVVDGFETRKAAILHKAFSGELTEKWRCENNVKIESWENKKFKEFCLLKRGFDLPATKRINGVYPLVSSSGVIDTHSAACVKGPGVVTGRSGTIGKVFYIEEDYWPLNTTLYSADLFENDAKYVSYYLQTFDFKSFSSSTAVPTLNRNRFMDEMVLVPKVEEQKEIVFILESLLNKEQQTKEIAETIIQRIDIIKKAILARAFRGELGTNNPSEESAIELIKQIIEEKIKTEESKPKRTPTKRKEVGFVAKTILEALKSSEKLTPEKLKVETALEIDDFYDQLKVLIDNGQIREIRIDGESYLEAVK